MQFYLLDVYHDQGITGKVDAPPLCGLVTYGLSRPAFRRLCLPRLLYCGFCHREKCAHQCRLGCDSIWDFGNQNHSTVMDDTEKVT